jgi:hypothetical protein
MAASLKEVRREQRLRAESAALAEVEWFFARVMGTVPEVGEAPATREAASTIQGWLRAISTFHFGALALRFTPRDWPDSIAAEFGLWTSLIVRLECAAHPSEGQRDASEVETAAVIRLEEMLADGGRKSELLRLGTHAAQHVRAAIRAYVEVRGRGPSVLRRRGRVRQ